MAFVLRRTGVAALLTTLTTAIGFGSGLLAHYAGLRSLATVAVLGIGFAMLAATVFLPCLIALVDPLARRGLERRCETREPS